MAPKLPKFMKDHVLVAFYRGKGRDTINFAKGLQNNEEQDLQWKLNLPESEMLSGSGEYVSDDVVVVNSKEAAEGVTSLDPTLPSQVPEGLEGPLTFEDLVNPDPRGPGDFQMHRPVLDIDFEAALIPSSTEGHYHLYLDKPMTWEQYKRLLHALKEAGIIEPGYAQASLERGYSSARLPGVKK